MLSVDVITHKKKLLREANDLEGACGLAAYRTIAKEKEQFESLQRKWGSRVVRRDFLDASRKKKRKITTYDINPILKVPVGGV